MLAISATAMGDRGIARVAARLAPRITELGLGSNVNVTRVDLRAMQRLRRTPFRFLAECPSLQLVNLSGLPRLVTIHGKLAFDCPRLTTINLRNLTALQRMGPGSLYCCPALTSITFEDPDHVPTI